MSRAKKGPQRVAVTGLGGVTPIGHGIDAFWEALVAGRSGVSRVTRFDTDRFPTKIAAEVRDFEPERWIDNKIVQRTDRVTHYGLAASAMAFVDAGLDTHRFNPARAGVIVGSGIGGVDTIEAGHIQYLQKGPKPISPFFVSRLMINMTASMVSITFGLKGPISAPSMACSTGSTAIGEAFRAIQRGDADLMLAGSTEACITPLPFAGFCAARSMSRRNNDPPGASRPFSADRDGFVMGEGAGIAVLERLDLAEARGARIYAELVGYGNTADAFHFTAPHPQGEGMINVMRAALSDAGLAPEAVDHINAHGTATTLNDRIESLAIETVFGPHAEKLKVSAVKSMIGHLLAGAGSVEFLATVKAVQTGIVPPTINREAPDPQCRLDYVTGGAETVSVKAALTNSFGFGGGNACLCVRRYRNGRVA
ncbi:MAG: beta-ketoacyl-ACP synthase II [Desulfobacterales bacterium]|jgi:3-oxoacyl-[acyl-carrier-protein] synthase II